MSFEPGLVGGHCIGVDPYYLTHKAQALGLHPEMILVGRAINDSVPKRVAEAVLKRLVKTKPEITKAAYLGATFKEIVRTYEIQSLKTYLWIYVNSVCRLMYMTQLPRQRCWKTFMAKHV